MILEPHECRICIVNLDYSKYHMESPNRTISRQYLPVLAWRSRVTHSCFISRIDVIQGAVSFANIQGSVEKEERDDLRIVSVL